MENEDYKTKDYEYLAGKELTCSDQDGTENMITVAFAPEYYMGITLLYEGDPNNKAICTNGPSSPNKSIYEEFKKNYDLKFLTLIRMIEEGHVSFEEFVRVAEYPNGPEYFGRMNCLTGM